MLPACAAVCPKMCRVGLSTTLSPKRFTLEAVSVKVSTVRWRSFIFFGGEIFCFLIFFLGWDKKYSLKKNAFSVGL